jgi:hypothetical protein
MFFGKS